MRKISGCLGKQLVSDKVHLTLEQLGFELHESTSTWTFSVNTCTVFHPWLGVHRCGGQTVCIDLCHFIQRIRASIDFAIYQGPGISPPWIPRNNLSFG